MVPCFKERLAIPAGSLREGVLNGAMPDKPLCMCGFCSVGVYRGGRLAWSSPPTQACSLPPSRAGQAPSVLPLLLQLCDPALLMEGMGMTRGGVHAFPLYFQ